MMKRLLFLSIVFVRFPFIFSFTLLKEIFTEFGTDAAYVYQRIVEFGFYFADTMGCSLSYEDLICFQHGGGIKP